MTTYTQEDLDNGILRVDMDRYKKDEIFEDEIDKIFWQNKLRVWMVRYDSENNPDNYTSLPCLSSLQKMLDKGLKIATKEEYLRVKEFLIESLKNKNPVSDAEKHKFNQILNACIDQLKLEAKNIIRGN